MKKSILAILIAAVTVTGCTQKLLNDKSNINMEKTLQLTQEWDKTFAKSDKVQHKKVTFHNRYGITLAADMYIPIAIPEGGKFAAIAVSGPFGAVKEQSSGLYAQHLAERGFLTIAFDPSFTGESGGENNKKPQTPKAEIKKPQTPKAEKPQPSKAPVEIKKNENPVLNKPVISVSKAPNNPFQNIPVSSLQKFKDRNANNEIINKILIFILIILVISIVASAIYNFMRKKFGKEYKEDDGQDEAAKVVYIR